MPDPSRFLPISNSILRRCPSARQSFQVLRRRGPLQRSERAIGTTAASRALSSPSWAPHVLQLAIVPPTSRRAYPRNYNEDSRRSQSNSAQRPITNGGNVKFSYKVAAAYSGKGYRKFNQDEHHFSFDSVTSQRWRGGQPFSSTTPEITRIQSGQDSCFITNVGKTGAVAFGVADGVGGWMDQGIDSADFAHGLCTYMEDTARSHKGDARLPAFQLLETGYDRVCRDEYILGGGSTACIAVADPHGTLDVANLGDSGFMQLRLRKVHYFSDPQTHAFNTPYQLSRIPPKILAQIKEFGGGQPFSDAPSDASIMSHELQHGDVLVFATDGVWDNLSSQDMLQIVYERMDDLDLWIDQPAGPELSPAFARLTEQSMAGSGKTLQTLLATDIVQIAKDAGNNRRRDGPFAKAFQKAYPGEGYRGGKPDDIAVVVALVVEEDRSSFTLGKSKL